ncbi:DUF924 family protein [Bradymonas sediminis]|uniref:DUF924 domain-containing protein n=1 Tax=Bradymonas sediminis TaxID=1548548 RepID=A0A2Z4FIG8_9DELT|nr:DUF924 family protein [Bradymonas sediminis]AWV88732.1 DUF924 domain-containing protein [Bradymonas sediminis]TDP63575.1 uncharacterized protein (DUF924 family) [Bradymonas sediminis]
MQAKTINEVLDFWFGELDPQGSASPEIIESWRQKVAAFDQEIRRRFEGLYEAIVAGEREDWLETLEGVIAYVVVIDQLSRNMYRGSAKMYASDAQALGVALDAIDRGLDKQAVFAHRNFLYMPLMHSEELELQDRCVALYQAWHEEVEGAQKEEIAKRIGFANRHRDVVAQFGRFPHRNAILGRESTAEEVEFLKSPSAWF